MQQRPSPRSLALAARKKESSSVVRKEVKMGSCAFFLEGQEGLPSKSGPKKQRTAEISSDMFN